MHERKLAVGMVVSHIAALRLFFRRVLKRRLPMDSIPYPKYSHQRTPRVLSPELCPRLFETLREYRKKRRTWLFPGQPRADGNHPTGKAVWHVCHDAAQRAGIEKRVSPHMLRHSRASMNVGYVRAHRISSAALFAPLEHGSSDVPVPDGCHTVPIHDCREGRIG